MPADEAAAAVECRGLAVAYGVRAVLDRLDLSVAPGESVALLGPSGSGKTTVLHAVAGFVPPVEGEVWLAGRRVADARRQLPPEEREVGVLFQHYALWPHLRVVDNVAYPLNRGGLSRAAADRESRDLLARLQIGHLADRRPAELSGGEQQRVALARALGRRGRVNLFDEPTAHLDAALRAVVQREVADAARQTGAAMLWATHDPAEALAVADRVVLLRAGRAVQIGTPLEVYEQPVDLWAAELTGAASVLHADVRRVDGNELLLTIAGDLVRATAVGPARSGSGGQVLVRPDWASLGGPLPSVVRRVRFRGPHTDYELDTPAGALLIRAGGPPRVAPGTATGWRLHAAWLLPERPAREPVPRLTPVPRPDRDAPRARS